MQPSQSPSLISSSVASVSTSASVSASAAVSLTEVTPVSSKASSVSVSLSTSASLPSQQFHENGLCVVEDLFSSQIYDFDFFATESLSRFAEIQNIIQQKQLRFGVGLKEGYDEIVQRHRGRYEVTYEMKSLFEPFSQNVQLLDLVHQILGPDTVVANESLIISDSGTEVRRK
jgi:hypothetical protein